MIAGRLIPCFVSGALAMLAPLAALGAQGAPEARIARAVGSWNADSLGNQRVLVRVTADAASAPAVRVHIPWRRRDVHPEGKRIIVRTAGGRPVTNVVPLGISLSPARAAAAIAILLRARRPMRRVQRHRQHGDCRY